MESKRADEIKNLLLKIIIPLAFPLAGSFICGLITDRATNRHSDLESSDSSIQLDQSSSYGSSSTHGEEEEEEGEMESSNRASRKLVQAEIPCSTGRLLGGGHARHASLTKEIMVAQATGSSSEVSVNNQRFQDDHGRTAVPGGVEVETLKGAVAALEERTAGIESWFNDYCDMKEQESTYQKMQIMCLGMKLELLESQNQRLDAAVAEVRAAAAESAAMRAKLDILQREFKKMSRKSRQEFEAIDERILALDAQEAEMARRCQGFEQHIEEMKQLALQLQKEKGTNNENVEVIVERSMRKLSSSKDLLDGLGALRDRWAADMEELIYLGWITAWLQHDLLVSDGEAGGGRGKGTVAIVADVDDEDGLTAAEQKKKKGEKMVAAAAPTSEVELCRASSSEPGKEEEESCMGRAGCRTGIGRPRLLRRLRGWARGKDAASRSGGPCRIQGP